MGLNPSKGQMYEFIDFTWNTVKGRCLHDCTYCYMKRWGTMKPARFDKGELKTGLGENNFIFVGSSCDMFAADIPREWIGETLRHCLRFPKNRYLFQSKNPAVMATFLRELRELRAVVCTTIETNRWYPEVMQSSPSPEDRSEGMTHLSKLDHYVTIEPIMDFDLEPMVELIKRCEPVQVNIGADSGNNNLPEPSIERVMELVEELNKFTVVAKKRNLERLTRRV